MQKLWNDIPLFDKKICEFEPFITPHIIESDKKTPAVIILPGGGYTLCSDKEKHNFAQWFNSLGISAFCVEYRVSPNRYPTQLLDARRAVRYVRYNSEKYNIDKEKVLIIGFSAGGHLAALTSSDIDDDKEFFKDEIDKENGKPNLCVLAYPVITFGEYAHIGSAKNLLGEENLNWQNIKKFSLQNTVNKNTPPTFLFHTFEDPVVPVMNSIYYAQKLSEFNIPYDLHIFQGGCHGLNFANDDKYAKNWTKLLALWLDRYGYTNFN